MDTTAATTACKCSELISAACNRCRFWLVMGVEKRRFVMRIRRGYAKDERVCMLV